MADPNCILNERHSLVLFPALNSGIWSVSHWGLSGQQRHQLTLCIVQDWYHLGTEDTRGETSYKAGRVGLQ